ncbi:hypothetical protein, variant [Anopheles sinensis]|uniref:Uncharacterized protein n=1 Tax=Anopheles sinensis TaxID=74873 RepID=A0A084WND7_ANOSI|nr:hypothetical protein, variant [Anopheles sinensis]
MQAVASGHYLIRVGRSKTQVNVDDDVDVAVTPGATEPRSRSATQIERGSE